MRKLAKRITFLAICFSILLSSKSFGQNFRSARAHQEAVGEHESGFQVISGMGIGLTGFHQFTNFAMVDKTGFNYDTISLLRNPKIRRIANVSREAFYDMHRDYAKATAEMRSLALSSVYISEHHDTLKAKFMAMETELQSQLDPQQLEALQQARHQVGFEQNGAEYLASDDAAEFFGLSRTTTTTLAEADANLKKHIESSKQSLFVQANKALLKKLPEEKLEQLKSLLDDKQMDRFLEHALFPNGVTKTSKQNAARKMLRKLCNRSTRKKLGLTSKQDEEVRQLRINQNTISDEDLGKQISETLTDEQSQQFVVIALKRDLKKSGTVAELSRGNLAQYLELSESESESLVEAGKRLQKELQSKMRAAIAEGLEELVGADVSAESLKKISTLLSQERISQND